MSHATRSRAAYRRLLRAVDTHITAVGGNTMWRDAVRQRFRAARTQEGGPGVEAALRRAEDLAFLVNSVNEHKVRLTPVQETIARDWKAYSAVHVHSLAAQTHFLLPGGAVQNLLMSYGISLDKEQQARERVKNTAKRVGLLVRDEDFSFRPDETEAKRQPSR